MILISKYICPGSIKLGDHERQSFTHPETKDVSSEDFTYSKNVYSETGDLRWVFPMGDWGSSEF